MENQRVRLSKMLLQSSLTELLADKNIHKISVREICDKAQINRTTFYKYYGSQYDLLKEMEDEVLANIEAFLDVDKEQEGYDIRALEKIIMYLEDNLELCRLLINNTVDSEFPIKLLNLSRIHQLLNEKMSGEFEPDEIEYVYHFVVNGGYSILKDWVNKDKRESPEKVARVMVNIMYRLFIKRDSF